MKDGNNSKNSMQENKLNKVSVIGFWCSWISSILGIVLGIIGLCQIKKKNEIGKSFAIVGIVIGSIKLIYLVDIIFFTYPSITPDLAFRTACLNVDSNGNYENVVDENDTGKIICNNFVCEATYEGKTYSYKCD